MKRLTAKVDDGGAVLLGSPSPIELAERLHRFEQVFDEDTTYARAGSVAGTDEGGKRLSDYKRYIFKRLWHNK